MLVVTMGDPCGVNVEILAKCWSFLLQEASQLHRASSGRSRSGVLVVGSFHHWQDQWSKLKSNHIFKQNSEDLSDIPVFERVDFHKKCHADRHFFSSLPPLSFVNIDAEGDRKVGAQDLTPAERGGIAKRPLELLKETPFCPWLDPHEKLAVVTCPVDKYALTTAGFDKPGQTEYFEELWGSEAIMVLAGPRLRVGLVTNHHPLQDVPGLISKKLVMRKIELFTSVLRKIFLAKHPKIAVTGLNPHAGDFGKFGTEEQHVIAPAIEQVKRITDNCTLVGPLPADTAFYDGYRGIYDGVLAMYHDQGLGPLKTVHFDEAVNISGGLPHLRISPDHGPARNLFLKGEASEKSLQKALQMALSYLKNTSG